MMNVNDPSNNFTKLDQYHFERLLGSRRKLLTLSLLFAIPAISLFIFYITVNVGVHCITYGVICIVYFSLYLLWKKNILWTWIVTVMFYLLHTYYELNAGLDLSFLEKFGLVKNQDIGSRSLYLIFIDIIRFVYPPLRVLLVLNFLNELRVYFRLKRESKKFDLMLDKISESDLDFGCFMKK